MAKTAMGMGVHTKHLAGAGAGTHKQHRPLMSKANKIFAMNGSGSGNHRRKSIGCVCRIHLLYLHNWGKERMKRKELRTGHTRRITGNSAQYNAILRAVRMSRKTTKKKLLLSQGKKPVNL